VKLFGTEFKFNGFDIWHSGNFDPSTKVDKVAGKQLSTEDYTTAEKTKLSGVSTGANNYIHPVTHPPSIIAQDASNRFVTDTEKSAWNGKAPGGYGLGVALSGVVVSNSNNATTTGMYYASSGDPNKPAGVTDGALFVMAYSSVWVNQLYLDWRTNKSYRRMCTNGVWSAWLEMASTVVVTTLANGLMIAADKAKLDGIATGANAYTHPASHPPSIITQDASNRFVTDAEKTAWNAKAAGTHTHTKSQITDMPTSLSQFINDIGAGAGLNIIASPTEPTLNTGDWWYQEI